MNWKKDVCLVYVSDSKYESIGLALFHYLNSGKGTDSRFSLYLHTALTVFRKKAPRQHRVRTDMAAESDTPESDTPEYQLQPLPKLCELDQSHHTSGLS